MIMWKAHFVFHLQHKTNQAQIHYKVTGNVAMLPVVANYVASKYNTGKGSLNKFHALM